MEYIEDTLPTETPSAFGLHANAGIVFRLREGEQFTEQLNSLQAQSAAVGGGISTEEKAKMVGRERNRATSFPLPGHLSSITLDYTHFARSAVTEASWCKGM